MPAAPSLGLFSGLDELPADARSLFATGRRCDFALGWEWFRNVVENGLPADARPCFAVLSRGQIPLAILPLQGDRKGGLAGLTNCYTCVYRPLIAEDAPPCETARLLGRELGRLCRGRPVVRLDALPVEWTAIDAFVAGVSEAGLAVRRFANFGNWHHVFAGQSWQQYLSSRPGSLRELIRRKTKHAIRAGRLDFEIVSGPADLCRGIAAFEAVYGRSWKPPEPHPRFIPGLMREAAGTGALRLAIAWRAGIPVAVQLWVVAGGCATVMKLAHDEAHAALSPGTLLTAWAVEGLLRDGIEMIDFGRGDDDYKRLWAGTRRQRIGVLVLDRRRPRGLFELALHDAGVALHPFRARLAALSNAQHA